MGKWPDDPESYSAGENENAQRQPAADGRSGANVTPAIYYMNKDNMLQQVVGLPDKENPYIVMGEKE